MTRTEKYKSLREELNRESEWIKNSLEMLNVVKEELSYQTAKANLYEKISKSYEEIFRNE